VFLMARSGSGEAESIADPRGGWRSQLAGEAGYPPEGQGHPDSGQPPVGRTGSLFGLPAIWLRYNCPCSQCRDPATGERLVGITSLPSDVSVAEAKRSGNVIEVVFGPDGHQAAFDAGWLGQFGTAEAGDGSARPGPGTARPAWPPPGRDDSRTEDAKRLWAGADIASSFPQGSWQLLQAEPAHRQACLEAVLRDGFVVLRDVPTEPGTLLTVARRFGFVRETERGPLVDVRVSARPSSSTFTSQAVAPRTGMTFRDPVPTLQFTHCLEQVADGGETVAVDGFHAAATLRAEHPRAFAVLAGTEVTFAYADAASDLRATRPVISVNSRGRVREIRLDAGLMQPLRMPPAEVVEFYDAYRAFAELIVQPTQAATFQLRPGDCLVLDNTRILTGRTAFTSTTRRHMQLCWADLDGVTSALALLRRARQNGHSRT
jgi:gamma-butyrobetaine dioxygenase